MKNNIITSFIKEEIRLHIDLTNSKNFYTYPIFVILFFSVLTIFSKIFFQTFDTKTIDIMAINILFVGGFMSGTFGLYARDFLERKFGDIGKLFQNALIQPISLNKIFLSNALSDIFFYLFWFILPLMTGYLIGLLVLQESISNIFYLFIAGFLSFTSGLLISFVLSITYERSKRIFGLILLISSILIYYTIKYIGLFNVSPFHIFYFEQDIKSLIIAFSTVFLLGTAAYFSVGREYQTTIKKSKNIKSIHFSKRFNTYLTKDYIDMRRTGDILGKPLFNVFIPSILVLFMFMNSNNLALFELGPLFFAIIIGTLGTQILSSLISSDNMTYYRHLPMKLENFIKPKIKLSFIICLIQSIILLILYAYIINDFTDIFTAIIVVFTLLIYNFNLSFYLTGLSPNENMMHSKTLVTYFILLVPILILLVIINILYKSNLLLYILLFFIPCVLLAKLYFNMGIKRWSKRE